MFINRVCGSINKYKQGNRLSEFRFESWLFGLLAVSPRECHLAWWRLRRLTVILSLVIPLRPLTGLL